MEENLDWARLGLSGVELEKDMRDALKISIRSTCGLCRIFRLNIMTSHYHESL
jgi:hypothetical protein